MPSWKRALVVLWIVQFLTTLAMNLGLTFVPFFLAEDPHLHVTDHHDLVLYTSLILAGPFFTTILATPLWGWVADRSGRKRQVVRAAVGLGLTQILMALARTPEQLVAIRLLQGMISGVLAACLGLMAAMAPEDHRGRAIATLQSAIPAGQIFGPVFGGFLASAIGYRPVYWVLGSLVLLTGLLALALVREEGFVPRKGRGNPFVELWAACGTPPGTAPCARPSQSSWSARSPGPPPRWSSPSTPARSSPPGPRPGASPPRSSRRASASPPSP